MGASSAVSTIRATEQPVDWAGRANMGFNHARTRCEFPDRALLPAGASARSPAPRNHQRRLETRGAAPGTHALPEVWDLAVAVARGLSGPGCGGVARIAS